MKKLLQWRLKWLRALAAAPPALSAVDRDFLVTLAQILEEAKRATLVDGTQYVPLTNKAVTIVAERLRTIAQRMPT